MASFNGNIDLLKLKDAKLMSMEENGAQRNYVCIPLDFNEISVKENPQTHEQMAVLRVNIWPYNEAYGNAIRQKAIQRGDDPNKKDVPSHEMVMNFTPEFVKFYAKAVAKRVIDADGGKHPEWATQDPTDENTSLFKAVRNRMNFRLCNLYLHKAQPKPQAAYTAPVAQGVSGYVAPKPDEDPFAGAPTNEDDLPF